MKSTLYSNARLPVEADASVSYLRSAAVARVGVDNMPAGLQAGMALQRALVDDRRAGRVDDVLLLLQHPHVLTLGVRGDGGRSHIPSGHHCG